MSKNLVLVIFNLIVIALLIICPVWGFKINDKLSVKSYIQLKKQKEEYDVLLKKYNVLINENYNKALTSLEDEKKNFEESKQNFEQIKNVNSYDKLIELSKSRQYNLEFIWVKLDLLARNNDLAANFQLNKSTETTYYDISVKLTGDYLAVKNYIYDILIDMELQFKSENIVIEASGDGVVATFSIKNVDIVM